MIVRKFLAWSREVSAGERAWGLSALARGYLQSTMSAELRREAEAAFAAALDDPSPQVRRALAEVLAPVAQAPRHIVIALANDQPDIAALVLAQSPLLSEADLVDCASMGEGLAQVAIASRPQLSAIVATVIADKGHRDALVALARNVSADIPRTSLLRMVERCGEDGELRDAILQRDELPIAVRADLVGSTAASLAQFVTDCGWLGRDRAEHVTRESTERATALIAFDAYCEDDVEGCVEMVRHLRQRGRLTPAFILRMLFTGDRSFFIASLADLSGLPLARIAGFVRIHASGGFAALYARAQMPPDMLQVFRATLSAQDRHRVTSTTGQGTLLRILISDVLREGSAQMPATLQALLRRLEAEAAREEARHFASRLVAERGAFSPKSAIEGGLLAVARDAHAPVDA